MIDDYKRRVDVVGVFIYNYTYLDLVLAQWSVLERAKQVKGQQALHCFALSNTAKFICLRYPEYPAGSTL